MPRVEYWAIENYTYRACPHPAREFGSVVSPHNHSHHSIENMGFLNQVVKLRFMRPFRGLLQSAFGLAGIEDLNYADIYYRSPLNVEDVLLTESASAADVGFESVHLAITDHDEIAGSLELQRAHPEAAERNPLGEEISIYFDDYLFHLGVTGMPAAGIEQLHSGLQAAAKERRLDDLFEMLRASGSLVVFNHPLVPWGKDAGRKIPAEALLSRYGWAIHALEYNGMRSRKENDRRSAVGQARGQAGGGRRRQPSAAGQFSTLADAGRELSGVCRGGQGGSRRVASSAHVFCAAELEDFSARTLFHRPLPEHRALSRPAGRAIC
jgi:hypothetical protein